MCRLQREAPPICFWRRRGHRCYFGSTYVPFALLSPPLFLPWLGTSTTPQYQVQLSQAQGDGRLAETGAATMSFQPMVLVKRTSAQLTIDRSSVEKGQDSPQSSRGVMVLH